MRVKDVMYRHPYMLEEVEGLEMRDIRETA